MPTVTLLVASALALIKLWLAIRIVRLRIGQRVSLGTGNNPIIEQRVRAHGNLTEYAPIALILMALIEMHHGSPTGLWVIGALFILGRLLHPISLARPAPNAFRAGAMMLTWGPILVLAIWGIMIAYAPTTGITYFG